MTAVVDAAPTVPPAVIDTDATVPAIGLVRVAAARSWPAICALIWARSIAAWSAVRSSAVATVGAAEDPAAPPPDAEFDPEPLAEPEPDEPEPDAPEPEAPEP